MSPALEYRRLRAPQLDGEVLLEPSLSRCFSLPQENRDIAETWDSDFFGKSLTALRSEARRELFNLAAEHTSQYADFKVPDNHDSLIVMSGHQPRLFHPGVWAKNFAISRFARKANGVAVQVIIDNDLMRDHSLRTPTGSLESPSIVVEPFDQFQEPLPFEARYVQDLSTLETFASRLSKRIHPLIKRPLVEEIWPTVMDTVRSGAPLGLAFAQARHQLERKWGVDTIEVPLSRLCETECFRRFLVYLLRNGQQLHSAYNERLIEYRTVNRLRSNAQPLPNLKTNDDWFEAPFWIWTDDDPTRRACWFRQRGQDIEIGNGTSCWTLTDSMRNPESGIDQLGANPELQSLRIRPRALTNTMFLRLIMSDVFIHGIGGAKYDQITDLLIQDLINVRPQQFVTLSQTTWLPVGGRRDSCADHRRKKQVLREMHFHPEQFLDDGLVDNSQVSCLIENKKKWIEKSLGKGERLERHRQIQQANAELRGFLQEKTEKQRILLKQSEMERRAATILDSREWSFCLFPEAFLKERLLDLCLTHS